MIKIGEETGNLEIVFKNLYEKYEFNQKIKKDVKKFEHLSSNSYSYSISNCVYIVKVCCT